MAQIIYLVDETPPIIIVKCPEVRGNRSWIRKCWRRLREPPSLR